MTNDSVQHLAGFENAGANEDGVVAAAQLAEEYFGAFWKYGTRQVEYRITRDVLSLWMRPYT